jgi:hypothetical protein
MTLLMPHSSLCEFIHFEVLIQEISNICLKMVPFNVEDLHSCKVGFSTDTTVFSSDCQYLFSMEKSKQNGNDKNVY